MPNCIACARQEVGDAGVSLPIEKRPGPDWKLRSATCFHLHGQATEKHDANIEAVGISGRVADIRHFPRAAERVHPTQPTLSEQLLS
jgi:hypothetical protein